MTTEFELHQKLRKYFKKIKIDPVYIELIEWKELEIVHPTIDITESLDIPTSCNFSEQNEAVEELEEPIITFNYLFSVVFPFRIQEGKYITFFG
jgi:hypothetical protein